MKEYFFLHKASHSTVNKCDTPERKYDSIQSAKVNISHSVQGENKTESVEVPESSQPQKLKLSGYIRDNLLNKYNQRTKDKDPSLKIDSDLPKSLFQNNKRLHIDWINSYTPHKMSTARAKHNLRSLDYYNSYSTTRRKMDELKESPNKLIKNKEFAKSKKIFSFEETEGALTRSRPSYSRYIHQLKGDNMKKGNIQISSGKLSKNKQLFAAKYSADHILDLDSPIVRRNQTNSINTSKKIDKNLYTNNTKFIETDLSHQYGNNIQKKKTAQNKRLSSQIFNKKLYPKFKNSPRMSSKGVNHAYSGSQNHKLSTERSNTYCET